jgi:BirA family biotin operon repressor/biotin-[acetyl-CoA-carboxylase] ligase
MSERGGSLTMSLVYQCYARHPRPWLIGMAVSLAVARTVRGKVRWPNDVVIDGLKVAGILTELFDAPGGSKVPVVGVGINLNDASFLSEVSGTAAAQVGEALEPRTLATKIVDQIALVPEPTTWPTIAQAWLSMDDTPGKPYRLPTGELAVALRVGNDGALVCLCDGREHTVMAAEAILG